MHRHSFRRLVTRALLLAVGMGLLVHAGLPAGHIRWVPSQCITGLAPSVSLKAAGSVSENAPAISLSLGAPPRPARALLVSTVPTRQLALLAEGPAAVFVQMLLL